MKNIIFLLLLCFCLAGCNSRQDYDKDLVRQGRELFRDDSYSGQITRVGCKYLLLELPYGFDIAQQSFYEKITLDIQNKSGHTYIRSGFNDTAMKYWNDNGFIFFGGSLQSWPEILELFKAQGAITIRDVQLYFRSPMEVAEIPLNWQSQESSVFVRGGASPRGFTLAAGDFVFRLSCMAWDQMPPIDTTYMEILPSHNSSQPAEGFVMTERGYARHYPQTIFEQLRLAAAIKNGHFIGVFLDKNQSSVAGNRFLEAKSELGHRQRILILAPHSEIISPVRSDRTR